MDHPTGDGLTREVTLDVTRSPTTPGSASRTTGSGRFTPGSIIAGRYRLVALLGRGGMGEVYRADDLTLDQPVALKFLTEGVAADSAADDARLAQFHNELRTARQVSHKNVCRLYDLGDADGRRFLTMEYVDGEDLGSLLRRIGRFPQDKALDIARQLCAGISAAHERGVLHRDLKPANIMLDGDGNVRITDFGIATKGSDIATLAGTPQYMAPELLAGKPASIRSDLYALGLVLFEIFTGRRVHEAKTLGDLKAFHDTGTITTPSAIVRDLDPAIERVILRCLSKDPDQRPPSALTVAVALPGGDPLAAALAAGETPSPELLAAAGESEALGVAKGLSAVAFILAGLIVMAVLSPYITIAGRSPLDKPPAVLVDRSQQILKSLGYSDPIADSASGFTTHQALLRWMAINDMRPKRWDTLREGSPSAMLFWYRTSPRLLTTTRTQPQITPTDPPLNVSGMTYILIDSTGRLIEFQAVPPQVASDDAPFAAPRWSALFDAASLDMATFTPATPQWSPRDYADTRAAWEGPMTGRPDLHVRVEAAAYHGRPTSMLLLGPWSRPTRQTVVTQSTSQTLVSALVSLVIVALVIVGLLLARHNLRAQRADRRGAARLAVFVMAGYAASWVISAHHVADVQQELNSFLSHFGGVLVNAAVLWVIYLALEPYVRRFWPDGILGWSRLLSGHVRDTRVGRDVLIGCTITIGIGAIQALYVYLPPFFGYRTDVPYFGSSVNALSSASATVSILFEQFIHGLFIATFIVLAYVLLRLVFRRTALAIAAGVALLALVQLQQVLSTSAPWWMEASFQVLIIAALMTVLVRYGLLVLTVVLAYGNMLGAIPLTNSLGNWTATTSNLALGTMLAVALFGFYASRAGQPLFGELKV